MVPDIAVLSSDGLQPNSDGLLPSSDGLQPNSDLHFGARYCSAS